MLEDYFRQYGLLMIFGAVCVAVPLGMLFISRLAQAFKIRPKKPTKVKGEIYECGMEPIGDRWVRFNFRYYFFALLFVIFEIEAVFLYPWAVQYKQLGLFGLVEMTVFILILVLGWVYAWRRNALEWQ